MSRFSIDWSELSLQVMITFGHFLWQACVIGVVLLVVQHVAELLRDSRYLLRLRRGNVSLGETDLRGANIRYTIACVAFFSLPIFVIATFAWVHQSRGPIMLVASDPVHSPPSPTASANEATPTMANTDIPVPPPAAPMNAEVPVTEPIEPPTLVVEPQTSPVQRIQAFAPYLLLAYIVGVSFMLARFSLSIIGSSRLRQTIQPITDASLLKTIAEQCARVGLKRVPVVAICQRVSVPVVVGIVKPMILLPSALLCGLDPTQIAAILSHEIAHIRRYDLIFNLLQRVVEALLFFHPVTWWISRRVSIERENCCDDVAAACMGRLPYAGALLQMAELCIGNDHRRKAALATLSASGSNSTDLGYRIRRLIGAEETTRVGFNRRSFSIGLALVSLLTVSLVAWGQSQKSEKKDAEVDIQWSTSGDKDGLLSGLRLILPQSELTPGQPLVVEYRLTNVSKDTKTLKCYLNKGMQFTSLSHGNRISGFAERQREPVTITIEPGDVFIDQEHLVSIDTTGLEPGKYHAALGSGFHYSDSVDPNIIHEIPHRGSIPFTIVGESTLKISELPKSDIHWGAPIAGLQVGARFVGDPNAIAIGESVEADLFVANVTSQPIECSVALPHISHGWLFSVMDSNGSAIKLDGPFPLIHSPFPERRVIPLTLAPGEVSPITVDELPLRSCPSFATSRTTQRYLTWQSGADLAGSTTWPKYSIYSLMTQGGAYSATFHVTLMRPELPNLRLELDSGNVPFSVGLQENKPIDIFGTSDLKDEDVAAFVDKTLTKPYRPNLGGGSWQLGAHEYSIILTLESIPQQQLVADALMNKIEFSHGSFDMHARKLAMDYCAQHFPDRLLPYLVRRLSATDFPEPDLSTSGQAFPSYYELTVLGDFGEQGKVAIPALMKHLSAGDPIAREATIRSLVRVGPSDPEVMQSLSKCFNDSNVRVQGTAVYQAGRYGELSKPLGPKFVELLEAKSKEVQFWAAAALITSKFNPDLGFERLLAGAKAGERKDRRQALTTLAMLGSRSLAITPELRSMLNDTDPEVVREVRETIRRIEANDRIVTHAEEAVQKAAARELVSVVAENPANRQTAGALKGRVTVDGVVPLLPKLRVPPPKSPRLSRRPTDEELRKFEASLVEIDDESIQVNADQGLANAFVYLAKVPSNWQPTQEDLKPFTLTIQDYRFEPRAAIVRTGQDVRLNNSSDAADNFAFESMKNGGQNRAVEAGSEITLKHPFTITERTPVQAKSHIHPWKTAFLLPLDHPFAAITDSQGKFSIKGLPPGEHQFLIWHERTGWLEKSLVVNIEAGQTTEVNRSYSVDRFRLAANHIDQDSTVGQSEIDEAIDPATKLGRATHQRMAVIDTLPKFYWASNNGTLGTFNLENPSDDSFDNLIRSLDADDGGAKWFTYSAQFGWDEDHFIQATGGDPPEDLAQFRWGTSEMAAERNGRGDNVSHVVRRDAATMWKDNYLTFPNYILATRHVFWWGDNGDHRKILAGSGVPPTFADYEQLLDREFDGELCHVIRSKARKEMLIISKASGLLRGYVLIDPHKYAEEVYKSDAVKKITGVEFKTAQEYSNWSRENELTMASRQRWELSKAWALAADWSSSESSLLVRFRDYREIVPGVMWPFREDRVQGSMRNGKFECMRSYDRVQTVVVDKDLSDKVNGMRPKEGERVQDQRFQAIVNYKFSKDRMESEIMELVDEAFQLQMKNQLVVDQATIPYESMIGTSAPELPDETWVGGQRPELAGKPYLIHFWATWCGPCKNDLPLLKRFSDAGGIVIGMHPGGTPVDEVTAAIKSAELSYPTYVSPEKSSSDKPMIAAYPATMYPYCLLVDGKGVVVAHGSLSDEKFDLFPRYWELVKSDEPLQPKFLEDKKSPLESKNDVRKRVHDLGGTMEVRERKGDAEEVYLKLMSKDPLASDEDLKLFATLKNLTRLEFRADHITSQGLDQISQMSSLKNLELWDCGLSDNDVGKLTSLKQLESLGFYNCRNVTDRSSQHLLQLPELHSLNLYGTPITVSFLQAIQGPRIRFLDLRRTGINAKDLSVIEKFPNLRQINLPDEVTDADLSHLSGLSELKILTLQDINISDKGLLHLKSLTKVETLYLRNTQITDAGLSNILDMQNLKTLDLSGTQISSAGLLPLATLPKLQTLDLQRTQVDDEGLKILSQFPRLQFLDLQDTNTTEAAVNALRNARPKIKIQWSK